MGKIVIPQMDAMFFSTETVESPKHVGSVQIFKLPTNAAQNYMRDLVEKFRQAPVIAPFNYVPHIPRYGKPEWRKEKNMDMEYHVRHLALPKPGSTEQLMQEVQELHAPLLDRHRPVWVCHIIEGLEGNRFAVYSKLHHSLVDGASGAQRMHAALSTSAKESTITPIWSLEAKSKKIGGNHKKRRPAKGKTITETARIFGDLSMQWLNIKEQQSQIPYTAEHTRTNRPLTSERRSTAICKLALDSVKKVSSKLDSTLNEVVLALVGAALQDYLHELGDDTDFPLVALCPMSLRQNGDDSPTTQVAAVHINLGDPDASIVKRVEQVVRSSQQAKDQFSGVPKEGMMGFSMLSFALMDILNRSKLDKHIGTSYNVLVSNVPGPQGENLYLCGSRMEGSYPISTLMPGVNLNITLLSHANSLDFGIMGEMDSLPQLNILADRIVFHFNELEKALSPHKRATKVKRKTK